MKIELTVQELTELAIHRLVDKGALLSEIETILNWTINSIDFSQTTITVEQKVKEDDF